MSDYQRLQDQFRETTWERNERLAKARRQRVLDTHWKLIDDLSGFLADEGMLLSIDGVEALRRRVANALPADRCPDWLSRYRDPAVVASQ